MNPRPIHAALVPTRREAAPSSSGARGTSIARERIAPKGAALQPIPWGQPDRLLGRAVCWNVLDATPPTVIPFDPRKHARMKRCLAHFLHY